MQAFFRFGVDRFGADWGSPLSPRIMSQVTLVRAATCDMTGQTIGLKKAP